jgi:hypothetical protein
MFRLILVFRVAKNNLEHDNSHDQGDVPGVPVVPGNRGN